MQMRPWFGAEEKKAVCDYMDEDGFLTEFRHTEIFEKLIAEYTGSKHCIVVNNGTISLTLAAMACGVGAGDEVIVPNYTMIATPNSVKFFDAKPIFVDVEPDALCMNIAETEEAITKKTKAIMLVSANGRYPKAGIQEFEELAKKHNIALIEDSAQSLGSFYPDGRHIGAAGDVGSFSFSAPKIISTGQGGAIITNDDEIAERVRRLKDFGRSGGGNDIHDNIGYNFKFTELQAVVGIAQMEKLTWRVERKKEIYSLYRKLLKDVKQVQFFDHDLNCTTPWFIDVIVDNREQLQQHLKENGVGTRVMYPPINQQRAYQVGGNYPIAEWVGENGLWLPSMSQLSDQQVSKISNCICDFFK